MFAVSKLKPRQDSRRINELCIFSQTKWFYLFVFNGYTLTCNTYQHTKLCEKASTTEAYGRDPYVTIQGNFAQVRMRKLPQGDNAKFEMAKWNWLITVYRQWRGPMGVACVATGRRYPSTGQQPGFRKHHLRRQLIIHTLIKHVCVLPSGCIQAARLQPT